MHSLDAELETSASARHRRRLFDKGRKMALRLLGWISKCEGGGSHPESDRLSDVRGEQTSRIPEDGNDDDVFATSGDGFDPF